LGVGGGGWGGGGGPPPPGWGGVIWTLQASDLFPKTKRAWRLHHRPGSARLAGAKISACLAAFGSITVQLERRIQKVAVTPEGAEFDDFPVNFHLCETRAMSAPIDLPSAHCLNWRQTVLPGLRPTHRELPECARRSSFRWVDPSLWLVIAAPSIHHHDAIGKEAMSQDSSMSRMSPLPQSTTESPSTNDLPADHSPPCEPANSSCTCVVTFQGRKNIQANGFPPPPRTD